MYDALNALLSHHAVCLTWSQCIIHNAHHFYIFQPTYTLKLLHGLSPQQTEKIPFPAFDS